MPKQGPL